MTTTKGKINSWVSIKLKGLKTAKETIKKTLNVKLTVLDNICKYDLCYSGWVYR